MRDYSGVLLRNVAVGHVRGLGLVSQGKLVKTTVLSSIGLRVSPRGLRTIDSGCWCCNGNPECEESIEEVRE